jgi:uncharacterized protein YnzC (UPF0291/DUF896 family)
MLVGNEQKVRSALYHITDNDSVSHSLFFLVNSLGKGQHREKHNVITHHNVEISVEFSPAYLANFLTKVKANVHQTEIVTENNLVEEVYLLHALRIAS